MATRRRGFVRALAMGRPGRPASEREAVEAAFAGMPDHLSRNAKARRLGKLVAQRLVAMADDADGLERAFARALAQHGDPIARLVTDPDADLWAQLEKLRVEHFTARGCQWIDRRGWDAETGQVCAALAKRLARRFR